MDPLPEAPAAASPVPFRDALRFWARLGCISFGGPAAQIATMHEELVVRRRWLPEARFDHALNFGRLLPGPEAQQLATASGWLLHGARGGLAAGILFVLPAAVLLFALSWIYAVWGRLPAVEGVLWGAKAVVVALLVEAVLRLGKRALKRPVHAVLALAAVAALASGVAFPWLVVGGAVAGLLLPPAPATAPVPVVAAPTRGLLARTLRVLAIGLALWALPLLVLTAIGEPVRLAQQQYLSAPTRHLAVHSKLSSICRICRVDDIIQKLQMCEAI